MNTRKDGSKIYRPVCGRCHEHRNNSGTLFAKWGVKVFKKDHCENPDCRWVGEFSREQLDHDHKDGNKENNTPENIQTYYKNCHASKSKADGDHNGAKHKGKDNSHPLFEDAFDHFDFFESEEQCELKTA